MYDGALSGRQAPDRRAIGPADVGPATRSGYLLVLTWAFTLFNSARVVAYLPTLWAIQVSGDSSQHSLFTWMTWLGANLTMALWLYEEQGRRLGRAMAVNLCNAAMCAAVAATILAHRMG